MFKKIKLMLYELGIIKKNSIYRKIDYLKLLDIDISIYNKEIEVIDSSIVEYTDNIEDILTFDNVSEINRNIKKINQHSLYKLNIKHWYSEYGRYLSNDINYLNIWLDKAYELNELYEILKSDMTKHKPYNNSMKIKPYIINIENIVNDIFDIINK